MMILAMAYTRFKGTKAVCRRFGRLCSPPKQKSVIGKMHYAIARLHYGAGQTLSYTFARPEHNLYMVQFTTCSNLGNIQVSPPSFFSFHFFRDRADSRI